MNAFDLYGWQKTGTTPLEFWYSQQYDANILSTGAPAANVIRFVSLLVARPITIDRVGINVAVAGSGGTTNAGIALYSSDNMIPNKVLADFGTVDISTTGAKTITINQTLAPGFYFFAYNNGATSAPFINATTAGNSPRFFGFPNTLSQTAIGHLSANQTFGTFPDASALTIQTVTTVAPAIYFRLA